MAGNFPRIDYSARDFPTIKQALISFIEAQFPDDITDFTETEVGMMLLEIYCWVGDMLSFTIDLAANESYLPTAKQRQNIVNIVKLIGYIPKPPAAASVELKVQATSVGGFPNPATIPSGTKIQVEELTFELLTNYVLPASTEDAGPDSISGLPGPTFVEGRSEQETFSPVNNNPNQVYKLGVFPVIRNSVSVRVNSVLWAQVDALVFAGDTDSYQLDFDGDNAATIRFGDGISGRQVFVGDTIDVEYRVGGGKVGNIPSNIVNETVQANTIAGPVQLILTNPNPASGGDDEESIESIKFNAPRFVKTHGNAITKEDYDTLSSNFVDPTFGAIAKAVCFPRYGQTNSAANEVDIYVWARDGFENLVNTTQGLKDSLLVYLNARKVLVVDLFISDGDLKPIDLDIRVFISEKLRDMDDIKVDVENSITSFFNRDDLQPAQTFYVSELYGVLQNIVGVLQSVIGVPNTVLVVNDAIESTFVSGLTTTINLVTGNLLLNRFASGSVKFTSGAQTGRTYPIILNDPDTIRIDGILPDLQDNDTLELSSPPILQTDIPVADNEIYKLGNLTLSIFIRNEDTRESILVDVITIP